MWTRTFVLLAVFLTACATTEDSVVAKNDAIEDYIAAAELESVDSIRVGNNQRHRTITEYYVILEDRRQSYLMSFKRRCWELNGGNSVTPDIRRDHNVLSAKFDTYRGCRISAFYPLTEGQAQELLDLGERQGN